MADFYTCTDADELNHTDYGAAVEEYLDALEVKDWPETLVVEAHVRKTIPSADQLSFSLRVGDLMSEMVCEEYGDPDGHSDTKPFYDLARTYVADCLKKFEVWVCEESPSENVTVNVAEWVRANADHWLDNPDIAKWMEERDQVSLIWKAAVRYLMAFPEDEVVFVSYDPERQALNAEYRPLYAVKYIRFSQGDSND